MRKMKNINKLMKVTMVLSILLIATVVTANLMTYFGQVDTELNIKQSVTIDNKPYNVPIKCTLELQTGDSINITHMFSNDAKMCNVTINQTTSGLVTGLTLDFYDKDSNLIIFPFRLNASSNMEITMIYTTDINLESQKIKITTRFSIMKV